MHHPLYMHWNIFLLVWMKQLQNDAPPVLALAQPAHVFLQTDMPLSILSSTFAVERIARKKALKLDCLCIKCIRGAAHGVLYSTHASCSTYFGIIHIFLLDGRNSCIMEMQLSGTSGQGCCTVDIHQGLSPPVNMFVIIEQCSQSVWQCNCTEGTHKHVLLKTPKTGHKEGKGDRPVVLAPGSF